MTVKTRFAPSPTGYLHIGGVRTALFSWLYARNQGGQFVLRVEDTDRERSTQESIDIILEGMQWLGLDWDGDVIYQSERFGRYREVAESLLGEGQAYHCYCSKEELDELREAQIARGENPGYDGRCRDRQEPRAGVDPVIRFRMPDEGETVIEDVVRGTVTYGNDMLDDLVIMRADGSPTFHFCNVIDDADSGITHVIRGDDHLNNTARHVNMIAALGYERPVFAHLPLIMGEDGAKLSKRHGAVNVLDYREAGYLPDAMVNYLARLGWSHGDQELFTRAELIRLFDIKDVNASASRFSGEKLNWVNQQHIMQADPADLAPLLAAQLQREGVDLAAGPELEQIVVVYRERSETLRQLAADVGYLFTDAVTLDATAAKKQLRPVAGEPLRLLRAKWAALSEWNAAGIKDAMSEVCDELELKFGKVGMPVRVAITGGGMSPSIDATAELIGQDRCLVRLDAALEYIAAREAG